jgi:hypothetical protein
MAFSAQSMQRGYKEDNWGNQVSSVWKSVKKTGHWKGDAIQDNLSLEAKEQALLEASTRKRVVKTMQAGKLSIIL